MRCIVFELAGGGTYVPPPGRAKVAQTPGRARVKGLEMRAARDVLAGRLEMGPRNIMRPLFFTVGATLKPIWRAPSLTSFTLNLTLKMTS